MFCPSCGAEERHQSQFCRVCGADMRIVRTALQKPDAVTSAAVGARDEIGRAIAAKIHETRDMRELAKMAEDVLPEIEKFLESPEERRLRTIRNGVITAFIGLGATAFMMLFSLVMNENKFPWPVGLVPFFIGLGLIVNGLFFTLPKKDVPTYRTDPNPLSNRSPHSTAELTPPQAAQGMLPPPSVTESTTNLLEQGRQPVAVPRSRDTQG